MEQKNLTPQDQFSQTVRRYRLAADLAEAQRQHDWHRWWRLYCRLHQVPWPPTGRDVKLARLREAAGEVQR